MKRAAKLPPDEKVYLASRHLLVTDRSVVVGQDYYLLTEIVAVETVPEAHDSGLAFSFRVCGLTVLLGSIWFATGIEYPRDVIGVVFGILGAAAFFFTAQFWAKVTCKVELKTRSGKTLPAMSLSAGEAEHFSEAVTAAKIATEN